MCVCGWWRWLGIGPGPGGGAGKPSRPSLGQLPGTKRLGKLWNSRSTSRKTTGSSVASSSPRIKLGLEAMVWKEAEVRG